MSRTSANADVSSPRDVAESMTVSFSSVSTLSTPPKLSLICPPCWIRIRKGFCPPANCVNTSVICSGSMPIAALYCPVLMVRPSCRVFVSLAADPYPLSADSFLFSRSSRAFSIWLYCSASLAEIKPPACPFASAACCSARSRSPTRVGLMRSSNFWNSWFCRYSPTAASPAASSVCFASSLKLSTPAAAFFAAAPVSSNLSASPSAAFPAPVAAVTRSSRDFAPALTPLASTSTIRRSVLSLMS